MLSKNKELQELTKKFLQLLQSEFHILKPNTKVLQWFTVTWVDFHNELEKAKVKLSLPQKAEWMEYFNLQKAKVQEIQSIINRTNKEIDDIV
jgi:hypothetical protein